MNTLQSAVEKALSQPVPRHIETNIIPPIVHPMGKYWKQPKTENILIDDAHALMSRADFNELADYTQSQPTGVYEGKMWKMQKWSGHPMNPVKHDEWYLHWWGYSGHPDKCSGNVRKILIIE
jgi:hypothetical protein